MILHFSSFAIESSTRNTKALLNLLSWSIPCPGKLFLFYFIKYLSTANAHQPAIQAITQAITQAYTKYLRAPNAASKCG
jgi:hypothetical protein